jgi:6-pyruvoyltetrahydropterin/6-carboxytetrahydropterin synthase
LRGRTGEFAIPRLKRSLSSPRLPAFAMPYRICKSLEVENGHMLTKHPDKCRFPHGHTRKVEFVIEAEELDENQMVCDFKIVKDAVGEWLDTFDHALCMNTADPAYADFKSRYGERVIGFENQDPTTELMARTIFDHADTALTDYARRSDTRYRLAASVRLVRVRVWETTSSWAEYERERSH